jgi:type IV secretion system protein VirB8
VTDSELEKYWSEAAAWDFDRVEALRRSERNAWRIAAVSAGGALLTLVALALLVPLKKLVPFVIRVDKSTGIVDVVPTLARPIDPGQAVTRYFLTHYVMVCQRFDFETARSDYDECGAFQSAKRNEQWYALWKRTNPQSPLNRYKDGTVLRARVVAVSFLERTSRVSGLAQVRYVEEVHPAGSAQVQATHWIATIAYAYGKPSTNVRLRSLNPLGFKILQFSAQPEVALEQAPPPTRK